MVTLDGFNLFDERVEIEPGSLQRDSIEKTAAGLDGILSIDLGLRGRKIKQKGILRAKNSTQLREKIKAISQFLDGSTHTLNLGNGDLFENLRMDSFKHDLFEQTGSSVFTEYEINYTQLAV